jgi:hypothetical protein
VSANDIADSLLLLAPGFIFLKFVDVFGEQHRRLEWEWVVWSLIAALPIGLGAHAVRAIAERVFILDGEAWTSVEVGARFVLAVILGLVFAAGWRRVRASTAEWAVSLRRRLSDSAWDISLDDATRKGFGVQVTVAEGGSTITYYGKVGTFGYESAGAEPWLYLRFVYRWEGEEQGFALMDERTDGLLFHKDEILRLRFIAPQGAG